MNHRDLFDEIFAAAGRKGISKPELYRRAGLRQPAVSRAMSSDDCRYSTIDRLLKAADLKLVVVQDNTASEQLAKGQLF